MLNSDKAKTYYYIELIHFLHSTSTSVVNDADLAVFLHAKCFVA